jgi:uncharacterized membrane protein
MAAAAAVWTVGVGGAAIWRHQQFLSHRFDLGNMVQAVWSTAQGRPLQMTDAASGEQITRLGAHVDPILVLLAPLWWIYPGPELLLVVQAAALAAGIYPAVRLALKYTESALAAGLLGAWYLAFPWIVWNAFDDFHPVTLAIPLLLYAIWFLDEHRISLFAVFAGLAIMTGELIGLTVAGLGLWYAIRYRRFRVGGAISLVGAAWTVVAVAVIVPAFSEGEASRYYDRFESVGGSPAGLLKKLFTDPLVVIEQLTSATDIKYLVWLVAPTAFLALLAPLLLIAALPQLAVNLLAEWSTAALPMFHYVSALVPIVIAATIMALARFSARARVVAAGVALGAAVLVLSAYPPRPGAQAFIFPETYPAERRKAMREALELIPPSVPVTATNRLGAHLSERRVIQLFPERRGAKWAVVDTRNPWLPGYGEAPDPRDFRREIDRLDRDPAWQLRFAREGIRVYERVS